MNKALQRLIASPSFNVAVFALLLNYPWEFLQAPLFAGMAEAPHWEAIQRCSMAAVGDAVIMWAAYLVVSLLRADRLWIVQPRGSDLALFTALGLAITVLIERLALGGAWLQAWSYSAAMPVLPLVGIGLAPLLQWLLLPPLVAWFVKRQLEARVE